MASNVSIAKQICVINADCVHCEVLICVQAHNLPEKDTRVCVRDGPVNLFGNKICIKQTDGNQSRWGGLVWGADAKRSTCVISMTYFDLCSYTYAWIKVDTSCAFSITESQCAFCLCVFSDWGEVDRSSKASWTTIYVIMFDLRFSRRWLWKVYIVLWVVRPCNGGDIFFQNARLFHNYKALLPKIPHSSTM
jgi:hypothetical protein